MYLDIRNENHGIVGTFIGKIIFKKGMDMYLRKMQISINIMYWLVFYDPF